MTKKKQPTLWDEAFRAGAKEAARICLDRATEHSMGGLGEDWAKEREAEECAKEIRATLLKPAKRRPRT